jgi:uncharacterized protein (TIGR02266 family)
MEFGDGPKTSRVRIGYSVIDDDTLILELNPPSRRRRRATLPRDWDRPGPIHVIEPTRSQSPRGASKAPGPDRRASRRIEFEARVAFESKHNAAAGLIQNISAGGLFVATDQLCSIGDRVVLRFRLPSDQTLLAVDADVRWVGQSTSPRKRSAATGMGLEFVELAVDAAASINRFLRKRGALDA